MALLPILYTLGGLTVADVLAAKLFTFFYRNERRPDAVHFFRTHDGWHLALNEYRPPAGKKLKRPVICCHGLSGNHHGFDLGERISMARTLAEQGHPTFLLDLRGAGCSEKGGPGADKPLDWILSDHYRYDAPAAVEKVRQLTGADRIHWVGHSMGGMIAYAFLQGELAQKIQRCVILASPAKFHFYRPAHVLKPLLKLIPGVPLRTLTQSVAPLFEWFRPLQLVSGNINLAPGVFTLSAVNCQDQLPSSLLADFARFVKHGHYLDDDGRDMLEGMRNINTPTLFMVGEKDGTAGFKSVQSAYEACGSREKKFVGLGKNFGHQREYGHMTILVGRDVAEEVFPEIIAWLAKD